MTPPPAVRPEGVRVVYTDGQTVEPVSLRYLGLMDIGHGEGHIWRAVLPRPIKAGVAEFQIDVLPPHTEVIAG